MDKNQKMRWSKGEIELMKRTFGEEGQEVYKIRDVLLQLSSEPMELNEEVKTLLKKNLLPSLESDVPMLQQADLYFSLVRIKELNPGVAALHIEAKDIQNEYLQQQLAVLFGESNETGIKLTELRESGDKTQEERFVEMVAYFDIITYVESRLNEFIVMANQKEETEEELKKKAIINSMK